MRHSDSHSADVCVSSSVQRRLRRRGPRSQLSRLKRKIGKLGVTPPDEVSGEPETISSGRIAASQPNSLIIYSINIRCLLSKFAEFIVHIDQLQPHIIFVQESWLNATTEKVEIPGYTCISRATGLRVRIMEASFALLKSL